MKDIFFSRLFQDGFPIDDITWIRYRKNKNFLKIRNAEKGDTGIYNCKGINGFGSEEARIEVIIIGKQKQEQNCTVLGAHKCVNISEYKVEDQRWPQP